MKPGAALTIRNPGLLKVIKSDVGLTLPFAGDKPPASIALEHFQAIWDTGATNSVITKTVATRLGLKPISMTQVHTANGTAIQNVYLVNMMLPMKVGIRDVRVTEATLTGDVDVLIGMDIITMGDFSITHFEGKTCMSFRFPSLHEIDYVENVKMAQLPRAQRRALAREKAKL